ncbi:hypothetical protein D3C75_1203960 [compost metagenome]
MPKVLARPDSSPDFRNWLSLNTLTWSDRRQRWPSVQPSCAFGLNSGSYSLRSVDWVNAP